MHNKLNKSSLFLKNQTRLRKRVNTNANSNPYVYIFYTQTLKN